MRKTPLLIVGLVLAWASTAQARQPVVVELYTSQGCSSCGKADRILADIATRPGVLALTLGVDYWDYLGWPDTFARPEFTARQRDYVQKLALREIYTPQVVVDGREQVAGSDRAKVEALVRQAQRAPRDPVQMRFQHNGRVAFGGGRSPKGGGEVWMIRYRPGVQTVTVKRGENRGQTVTESNVVRELVRLGAWAGRPRVFALPEAQAPGLKTVILLQAAKGGRILGALQR